MESLEILSNGTTLTLYVSFEYGNDDNDGLTQATAIKTLQRSQQLLPLIYRNQSLAIVNIAGVGGFGNDATAAQLYEINGLNIGWSDAAGSHPISYRGPAHGVPYHPAHGAQAATVVSVEAVCAQKTRLYFDSPGWHSGGLICFARITHDGRDVLYELPIASNGVDWIEIDHSAAYPSGSVASYFSAGDQLTLVRPGVKIGSGGGGPNIGAVRFYGQGPMFNLALEGHPELPKGGANGYPFVFVEFFGSTYCSGIPGMGYDRCVFTSSDHNWVGGTVTHVNCLFTEGGVPFFQGGSCTLHDQAGCLPDVDGPIHGATWDPMVDIVCRGSYILIGSGGGLSGQGSGSSLTSMRGISVYDSNGGNAKPGGINVVGGSSLIVQGPNELRNGACALQGSGNSFYGVHVVTGGFVKLPGPGYSTDTITGSTCDICLGDSTKQYSWDEVRASGNYTNPLNFSRVTTVNY